MKYKNCCFLVTAYCDNEEKVSVMSDCIDNLKKISNNEVDILIHTHHTIDVDIQNKVKYVIFDKSNPILSYPTKGYNFWRRYKNYIMSVVTDDYGYAVLSQWKNGLNYLNNLNYDVVFIINYDTFIDNEMFDISYLESQKYHGVIYYWGDKMLNASYCVLSTKVSKLLNLITLERYLENMNDLFEIYLKVLIDESDFSFKHIVHDDYKEHFYTSMDINSSVRFIANTLPDNVITDPYVFFNHPYPESIKDGSKLICQYHIASKVDKNDTDILTFLFFNIKKEVSIKIKVDDIMIYDNIINDDLYLETSYKYTYFKDNELNIDLIIDDEIIDFRLIDKLKQNCRIENI